MYKVERKRERTSKNCFFFYFLFFSRLFALCELFHDVWQQQMVVNNSIQCGWQNSNSQCSLNVYSVVTCEIYKKRLNKRNKKEATTTIMMNEKYKKKQSPQLKRSHRSSTCFANRICNIAHTHTHSHI